MSSRSGGGVTAIEYGLITALIAVAAIAAMQGLGSQASKTLKIPASQTISVPQPCIGYYLTKPGDPTEEKWGKIVSISCPASGMVTLEDNGATIRITAPTESKTAVVPLRSPVDPPSDKSS